MSPMLDISTLAAMQTDPNVLANRFQGASPGYAAGAGSILNWQFDPNTATTGPVGQSFQPGGPPLSAQNLDALSVIRMYLQSLQMDDPAMVAWATAKLQQGASAAQIELEFRDQPAVRTRFAAVFDRQAAGMAPISFADQLAYESQARQLMREAGFPTGFYDAPDDFRKWIGGDVSLRELSTRIQQGFLALDQGDQATRDEMQRLYGTGVTTGQLAAWALDENRAVPTILRQVQAAQIGAAGRPAGYTLSSSDLESLAAYGVQRAQAQAGFGQLFGMRELFGALPGEGVGDITQAQQLGAAFTGNVAAQEEIQRRQQQRVAQFGEQGGPGPQAGGFGGFR